MITASANGGNAASSRQSSNRLSAATPSRSANASRRAVRGSATATTRARSGYRSAKLENVRPREPVPANAIVTGRLLVFWSPRRTRTQRVRHRHFEQAVIQLVHAVLHRVSRKPAPAFAGLPQPGGSNAGHPTIRHQISGHVQRPGRFRFVDDRMHRRMVRLGDPDHLRFTVRIGVLACVHRSELGSARSSSNVDVLQSVQPADGFRLDEHAPRPVDSGRQRYLRVKSRLLARDSRPLAGDGRLPYRAQRAISAFDMSDVLVLLDVRRVQVTGERHGVALELGRLEAPSDLVDEYAQQLADRG